MSTTTTDAPAPGKVIAVKQAVTQVVSGFTYGGVPVGSLVTDDEVTKVSTASIKALDDYATQAAAAAKAAVPVKVDPPAVTTPATPAVPPKPEAPKISKKAAGVIAGAGRLLAAKAAVKGVVDGFTYGGVSVGSFVSDQEITTVASAAIKAYDAYDKAPSI